MKYLWLIVLTAIICGFSACGDDKMKKDDKIHPSFTITAEQLETLLAGESEEVRNAVLAKPFLFLDIMKQILAQPEILYVLVDKNHALPADYEPDDLVNLHDNGITVSSGRDYLVMREIAIPDIKAMAEAARNDGMDLVFTSTYRSYATQERIYNNYVAQDGKAEADRYSAQPGKSQHQLGTTADFGSITEEFGDTPEGKWLYNNAADYGFSLSYPAGYEKVTGYMYEIWHYRYISRTGTLMQKEFFSDIQQYFLEFLHRNRSFFENSLVSDNEENH